MKRLTQITSILNRNRDHHDLPEGLIVIIARNNKHLTQKTVRSALAQEHPCKVWVVDNNSSDGTHDWLRAKAVSTEPRLYWWSYLTQRSLSACWNDALTRAFTQGYKRVLVLNNDVEIRGDCYRLLAAWQIDHRQHFTTGVSVNSKSELYPDRLPSTQSPHPDFSCFMITSACFDVVGDFNSLFWPAYCEDNDYHVRMHRAGINAMSIDLPFVHYAAGTIKHADPAEQSIIRCGAGQNKRLFRSMYGCYPDDTAKYNELFKPLTKGQRRTAASILSTHV